jgi:hypothetical protein
MRLFVLMLTLALMTGSACAQGMGGGGMGGGGMGGGGKGGKSRNAVQNTDQQKAAQQKRKAEEDAFKAAVQRIPDPKEKFDPWRGTR